MVEHIKALIIEIETLAIVVEQEMKKLDTNPLIFREILAVEPARVEMHLEDLKLSKEKVCHFLEKVSFV